MGISALLPVGNKLNSTTKLINKGDVVKLITGELVTFIEMKRTKFVGKMDGRAINVPIYRNPVLGVPYIAEVTGDKDDSVITKTSNINRFKYGQLFALEGHKETFMFVENIIKRGKQKTKAINVASNKTYILGEGFDIIKINIPKMKKEHELV